jgi:transglutaminase-like putative cysteine protease
VTPQDFHAVAEVYLGGSWHLIDPTGMADADTMARIGVGSDASSVAFLTSFGSMELVNQSVSVTRQA